LHTFTNSGTWGPPEGFPLPAEYLATTDWTLNFSARGDYTITFRLVDQATGAVIVEGEQAIKVDAYSTYAFSYEVPDLILEGEDVEIPVTFATDEKGSLGYEKVLFEFAATGDGDVVFKAVDSMGHLHTFTNSGTWGPPEGFPLPAEYLATTDWTLNFSARGDYTITFRLVDQATGAVIVEGEQAIKVDAYSTYAFSYEVPDLILEGEDVEIPVTFATDEKGSLGYEKVLFEFAATGDGDVVFKAVDSMGHLHTFTNSGTWGPPEGFPLPAEYLATTDWTLNFSARGDYTITFRLVDQATGAVIVEGEQAIKVDAYSTYAFSYEVPDLILEGEDVEIPVTFATDEKGSLGYEKVLFEFAATGDGDVVFKAVDSMGHLHTFTNSGTWGPPEGFPLPAEYLATTDWTLNFSARGDYTITFKLLDVTTYKVIAEGVQAVTVYPSLETVLADIDAQILSAIPRLNLEGTGISGITYGNRHAVFTISDLNKDIVAFAGSNVLEVFLEMFKDVKSAKIGDEVINLEGMTAGQLKLAIAEYLIYPLIGEDAATRNLIELVGKSAEAELTIVLGSATYKATYSVEFVAGEETVLADIDNRINAAIGRLNLEGTGISGITYADKHAVFTIDDLNKDIVAFAGSNVLEVFLEMFKDVKSAKIGDEVINLEGMTAGQLKLAIAEYLIYPLIGEDAATRNLIELVGKSAEAELTIVLGSATYKATYSVEFVAGEETVLADIDNRINAAIDRLNLEGTGISGIDYADKHAVFTISDLNKDIVAFASSNVLEVFLEMFKDVKTAKIGDEVINLEGMTAGQLKLAIAEYLIYPLIGEDAATRNLIELVGKSAEAELTIVLGSATYKATYSVEFVAGEETVLADIDNRINAAIGRLNLEGTGISGIDYADKHAVFTISDLNKDIVAFAGSNVLEVFLEMFKDVKSAKIGDEVINLEGMTAGQLKLAIAEYLIYPLIGEDAATRNLIELVGKSAEAELTIVLGSATYKATYSVEFVAGEETVLADIDNRINAAIGRLNLEGTGISGITYGNRHAVFTISDLNKDIVAFAGSNVLEVFLEMFKDVKSAKIGDEVINLEGMTAGQLKLAIAEHLIYPLIGEDAATRNLIELVGKSAEAELTIVLGSATYKATYSVEFVAGEDTVLADIDARINAAIDRLNLEGTGISGIDYADKHAVFTISDLNKDIVAFAGSNVLEVFLEMFKDVKTAKIGDEVINLEGMTAGQLKLAIAEYLIYPLIGEDAATRNLIELVGKSAEAELTIVLGSATYKATYSVEFVAGEETVLADIDNRINAAIGRLNLEGTGISGIDYADKHAVFTISDLNKDIVAFAGSNVLEVFLEMFKDVKSAKIGDEVINLEGMTAGQLKLAIAEYLIYPLIGEDAATRNLIELVGKSAEAELTIVLGSATYKATYSVEFVAGEETVLADIDNRINAAIDRLNLEGTGISGIDYADKHAVFTISDLNKDIVAFAGSNVLEVFLEMFKDVKSAKIGDEVINLEGMTAGQLKLAIAEHLIYPLIGEDAATRNLIELVGKSAEAELTIVLGSATYKATYSVEFVAGEDTVLADIDARINAAIDRLNLEGTGISGIDYADKHAVFTISDLNKDIVAFAGSNVLEVFLEMFKDVKTAKIGDEVINLEGMTAGQLKLAIAEYLIYPLIGEDAATRNLIELVGKSAEAELTIVLGSATYKATYSVEFVAGEETVLADIDNRINAAIGRLNLEGTGISGITYGNRHAVFTISDLNKDIVAFAGSNVLEVFLEMFKDVKSAKIGDEVINLEGMTAGQLKLAIAEYLIYPLIGEDAATRNLIELVGKSAEAELTIVLGSATYKANYSVEFVAGEETVLADIDNRINAAIDRLNLEGTGISGIDYADKHAVFTISDLNKDIVAFAGSNVLEVFLEMFKDVKSAKIGDEVINLEGMTAGQLKLAIAEYLIYPLIGEDAATRNLIELVGKSAEAELTIVLGSATYKATYSVEFVAGEETVLADIDNRINAAIDRLNLEGTGISGIDYADKHAVFTISDLNKDIVAFAGSNVLEVFLEMFKDVKTAKIGDEVINLEGMTAGQLKLAIAEYLIYPLIGEDAATRNLIELVGKSAEAELTIVLGSATYKATYSVEFVAGEETVLADIDNRINAAIGRLNLEGTGISGITYGNRHAVFTISDLNKDIVAFAGSNVLEVFLEMFKDVKSAKIGDEVINLEGMTAGQLKLAIAEYLIYPLIGEDAATRNLIELVGKSAEAELTIVLGSATYKATYSVEFVAGEETVLADIDNRINAAIDRLNLEGTGISGIDYADKHAVFTISDLNKDIVAFAGSNVLEVFLEMFKDVKSAKIGDEVINLEGMTAGQLKLAIAEYLIYPLIGEDAATRNLIELVGKSAEAELTIVLGSATYKATYSVEFVAGEETVLADIDNRINAAIGRLNLEGTGISGIDYADKHAVFTISDLNKDIVAFASSNVLEVFLEMFKDVKSAKIGDEVINLEGMTAGQLKLAIAEYLIYPLIGEDAATRNLIELVGKSAEAELTIVLGSATYKATYSVEFVAGEDTVLADIDARINAAIDRLNLEGTGISGIDYADKHAVFTISDLNKDIVAFAGSNVLEVFLEMFKDVKTAKIGDEVINLEGMTAGQLKLAIAEYLIYPLIGEDAATRNLIELVGKSAEAELTIVLGSATYKATYSVEFVAGEETVLADIDNRINAAIGRLNLEGTGISGITYGNRHAVFTISDLNKDIVAFAGSNVLEVFLEMFKDVKSAKIGDEVINLEGMTAGQLKLAIAEYLIYPLIGEDAATRNLIELVGKSAEAELTIVLGSATYKANYSVEFVAGEETVLADIDNRINAAIDRLNLEGTGISGIDYADKHAVFTISDLNKDIVAFAGSNVLEVFLEMFKDVKSAKIGDEVINLEGMTAGQLKLAIAEYLIYPLIGEDAATRNLIELVGKSAEAELTIVLGSATYKANYSVEFVAGEETVLADIDNRINAAIDRLNLEGTGISGIDYADKHAVFTISDLNKDIVAFAGSNVLEVFLEMFKDVKSAKIGDEVINLEGMTAGQLKLAIAEYLIYPLIGEDAATRNLIELVGKSAEAELTIVLGSATYKANYSVEFVAGEETVLADIDNRINAAIDRLNLEGTGISGIDYADKHAVFTISDLNKDIVAFAGSNVLEVFLEMFKDVKSAKIGDEVINLEGMTAGQLKLAIAEHLIYPLIGEDAATRNLIELVGKSAEAELTIVLGSATYKATYSVEFVAGEETVLADIDNRINAAIGRLNLEGTGISGITYGNRHAVFTISDLNKDIVAFAGSNVLEVFLEMFKDVKSAKIGDEVINLEGMTAGQLKLAIAEYLIYPLIGEDAATRNLIELVGKSASAELTIVLGSATYKAIYSVEFVAGEDTVLADIDARINAAIGRLNLEGTGISGITYADKHAVFTISDLNKDIVEFANSGVLEVFLEMFKDVKTAKIGEAVINLEGMTSGQLKLAIAEHLIYPLIGEDAATRNLIELVGKDASAELTIQLGSATYTATYTIEFNGDQAMADTVTTQIANLPSVDELSLDDRGAVGAARAAFDSLTAEQKGLVTNYQKLVAAEAKIEELEADLAAAEEANKFRITYAGVLALEVDTVALSNEDEVNAALSAFETLSEAAQGKLNDEEALLESLAEKIGQLKLEIQDVIGAVNALPPIDELTLDDKEAVEAARGAYDKLTSEQQELVTNYEKLVSAEARIEELEADLAATVEANNFRDTYAAVLSLAEDSVEISEKAAVTAAFSAYGELTEAAQNKLADEMALLESLLSKIEQLEQEVQNVIDAINAIPAVDVLTLNDKDAVETARRAYDNLTSGQRGFVTNFDKLVAAEAKIAELEADLAATIEADNFRAAHAAVLSLGEDTVKMSDEDAVSAALDDFGNLSIAAQNKLLPENTLLESLLYKIFYLLGEVDTVESIINSLPAADSLVLENWADVKAARAAYDALTDEQKDRVDSSIIQRLELAETRMEVLAAPVIADVIESKVIPAFLGFIDVINGQAPKSDPPYRLWIKHDLENLVAILLISKEAQGMDPITCLTGTGISTAFYSFVAVPEIQGASTTGKSISFKDAEGNPRSGGGFEFELMLFGGYLIGGIPDTVGEIIGLQQAMYLDCKTEHGIEFSMEITFDFREATEYASTEDIDFDIEVPYGTTGSDALAGLLDTVGITGTKYETADATIKWTISGYNGNEAGEYTATGKLTLPIGWAGYPDNITAKVKVALPIYTLNYTAAANGEITGETEQRVEHGSDGTQVEAIPAEGYHFVKWSDGSTVNPRTDTSVTADITVEAEFAINEYTVTFTDWDDRVIDTQTVEHGSGATAPDDPAREGYTFIGWDVVFDNVIADLTVAAQYKINQYTITFDSVSGTPVASITQDYGTDITPPADPTKTGYTFKGWDPIVPSTMPAENLTLVAQWEINQYTISFNSAGGSLVDSITQDYGTDITPPADLTREGYTFKGWDPIVPSTMPAEDLTLVAQWEINQYTISFNSAGGNLVDSITQDYGTDITPPADPTREGYTFKGWDPIVPSTMPAEDLTLVAQWEINQYTISFDSAGGTEVAAITLDYGETVTPPANPTKTGYTFKGWDPIVPSTMPAENLTLVAQWEINQYTITFDSVSGTPVASIAQDYGTDITPPADPTREGYTFKGWDPIVPSTMPAEDLTLVAQWEINQYTISFNSAGGSLVDSITQDYGTDITPPADPTREGYTFKGWDPIVPSTMPAENLTLVAQWEINQYTISFNSAGGSLVDSITQDYGTDITPPADPTREGYTFKGWDPIVPSTMPAEDLTLVAQWEINQYTISFDSAGGTEVAAITLDYGETVTPPANPTKTGYTFKGWDPIVPSTMPAKDLTLVAQWEINQYTITFDSVSGTPVASIAQDYGTDITPPADPTREGYTFKGWDPIVPSTMPAEDLTLVAQWEINQYTISFDSAGGTEVAAITLDYGETVTPPANPTKTGYTFKGWDPIVPSTMPAEDLTLVAQWEINQYTISFDSAGGTEVAAITLDYGKTVTPPANPTKTGYTFKGWDPIVPSTMPAENLTLVAQWEINQYTISFNSAGGTEVAAITLDYGETVTPPANPTKTGYTFKGWDPIVPSTMPAEDLTLVAQWEINQYTISFNSAGGSLVDSITQDYGTDITPPADPTREGYTFKGWDPIVPSTMPAEDLTLVAQWEINQYTISFNSAGGSLVDSITQDYGTDITPPADPTREGYTFKGWDPIVPSTMPAENLTLVAQWEINQYMITFDSAGGTEVAAITLDYGETVTPPANPTKTGYTFKGWDPIVPSTMPAEDLTLVAQWEINQYTISFDSAGGTEVAAITLDYGETVTPPANPTKTGYTFKGWDPIVPSTMPAKDLTLVAQWEINQYTITFDSVSGTPVASIAQDYGTDITPPADPTREGYTFKGWDPIVPSTMPAEDLTLVAQWEINQYTISFDSAGGTEVAAITLDYGETVTPPANPTKTGYTFKGWDPIVPSTMPAEDLTLVAQWEINQYTISFDSAGGTEVAAITLDYGETVTPPANPTKTGYTFKGWDPIVPSTMPAENLTLVAQWEINQYTISFNSAGGTEVAAITLDYGETVTPPANPTKTGYTFKGWDPIVPSTMPAEDLTLVAQWEINQYTISFNSAGGSLVDSITQDYGTDITPPADPTREGYTFKGWDPIVPSTMPAEDLTLVAQWEINQYTISFNSAGGSLVDSITQDYGTDITPPADPTREGYTFKGWDPIVPSTMPAENLTLVAQWEINQYMITFDSAGGTEVAAITLDYGETVTPPANPTKTGYTFKGWDPIVPSTMPAEALTLVAQWEINQYTISFDSAGGTEVAAITLDYGKTVTPPANPTKTGYTFKGWDPIVPSTMPAEDLTLVAQWEINQYTISFDSAGGTEVAAITLDYGKTVTPPANPTKTGYTFKGWDPIVPSTMPAEDLTLVAQWEINQYTISFDSAGGTEVAAITLDYGKTVTPPANPTKTGYTFKGWDPIVPSTMPAENLTLVAQWEINQYTISFDSAGGTEVAAITLDYGETVTPPANPTKTGYTFKGWDPIVPSTMPAKDLTLVAQWEINQYTITFDSVSGTPVASIAQDYGTDITPPADPTREGYTFKGWDPIVPSTMPAEDLTLVAQWEINQYTITFDSVSGTPVASIAQDYGTDITPPADPTREGYTFKGWDPIVPSTMPAEDLTLVAQWEINQYTISFNSAGGSLVDSITQDYGTDITPPADPTREGYTFKGWDPIVPSTMPAENLTLVAQWEINQYTISFNSAGGSLVDSITQDYGTDITPPADPTREGYTFKGWDPIVPSTMPAEDLTLVAQWEINQYTISFNSAGGTEVAAITLDYGETVTPPANPTKTGYTFKGWDPIVPSTMPAEDLTLVAQWEINQYTISFNSAGGSLVDSITQDYGTDITPPADPTREGYTFKGWDPIVPSTMPAEDLTLVAQWEINQYTISFNSAGGSLVDSITQDYGTDITPPADPTREGYTFKGWDPIVPSTMPAEDLTLVAQWEINQYMITFDSAGGSTVVSQTVNYGGKVIKPADPTKTEHTFEGWFTDENLSHAWNFDNDTVTADTTLYAKWEVKRYTITFVVTPADASLVVKISGGVLITPEPDGTYKLAKGNYNYTASAEGYVAETKGFPVSGDKTVTINLESEVAFVERLISSLPAVGNLTLDNREAVEVAEAAYDKLSEDRKAQVSQALKDKLNDAVEKITELVLADVDDRLLRAIDDLDYDAGGGTGIEIVNYEERTATFLIKDPTKQVYLFAFSGVIPLFEAMFEDVKFYRLNDGSLKEVSGDTLQIAIDIVCELLGLDPNNLGELMSKTLADLVGRSINIELTIQPGSRQYVETYQVKFELVKYDLTYTAGANGSISGAVEQTVEHGGNGTAVTAEPNLGYHFVRWSDGSTANPRTDTNVTSDISVTAEFATNKYTVTFKDRDTVLNTETVEHGKGAAAPENPTREGYTFSGWDKDFTNVTSDLVVTAWWTANIYTVTFDALGGTDPEAKQVTYDSAYGDLPTPEKMGYCFAGWFTASTGGDEITTGTIMTNAGDHKLIQ
jgi:uncharacterized repeat protein (TIGR02543 family)